MLDDKSGILECAVFGEGYDKYKELLNNSGIVIVEGNVAIDSFSNTPRLTVDKLYDIEQARAAFSKAIQFNWHSDSAASAIQWLNRLRDILTEHSKGQCPVEIHYSSNQAKASLRLGDAWRVQPTDELIRKLTRLPGSSAVEIKYK
ncbi:hypothetical protein [Methylocucumis oryzae]|uniref:hypothetical protein n=1 Tax=Methylocucumis oryzae TaxID=1632867 RepID=UPI001EF9F277|nr:hypothetical protein [Methylocucumis oryzae]